MKPMMRCRLAGIAASVICSMLFVGCSGSAGPVVGSVAGKVTLDGAAYGEGRVEMRDPVSSIVGGAELKPDGTFQVVTPEGGLRTGTYDVVVLPPPIPSLDPIEAAKGAKPPTDTSKIPAKYRDYKTSGIKATVVKGSNTVDVPMISK